MQPINFDHLEHPTRVESVAAQVRARPNGRRLTIRKLTHGHSVRDPAYKKDCHPVDVSTLDRVLHIDEEARTATVEGQVTMAQLAAATLARGLVPAVVPEFPNFTVSGLINGEGVQSSSHRYGTFTANVLAAEVLLGDGRVVTTSPTQEPELFSAIQRSLGTLGIVTAAVIRLVPAKPWVVTTIERHRTLESYVAAFEAALEKPAFLEGVVFGPDEYVLIKGDFADEPGNAQTYVPSEKGAPYYYQRVRARAAAGTAVQDAGTAVQDAIRTGEYLTRSARGLWWMVECHVGLPFLTNSPRFRKNVDEAVERGLAENGFTSPGAFTTEMRERCLINQDMGMWLPRLAEGIRYVQRELGVYPIWNCPILNTDPGTANRIIVDIGIYGEPMVPKYHHRPKLRALQLMVDYPSHWGVSYLTRAELEERGVFKREAYARVRETYGAKDAFLDIEDKVVWIDPGEGDGPAKIPLWRLQRSYGRFWPAKLVAGLAGFGAIGWALSLLVR